jgi:hypothetical protein
MKKSLFAAICDLRSTIFSPSFAFFRVHSRFKNSLKDSALRGRIALPGEEVPRRMRGTAGGTPAHPYEEAVSFLSLITNNQ